METQFVYSSPKKEKELQYFLFKLRRRVGGSALAVVSTRDGNKRAAVVTLSLQVLHFSLFRFRHRRRSNIHPSI